MKKMIITLLFSIITLVSTCQVIYHSDLFKGGITAGGFSTSIGQGSGSFDLNITAGSSIRKAFLFTIRFGEADTGSIILNNIQYFFDSTNQITNDFNLPPSGNSAIHCIEITNDINPSLQNYPVIIPQGYLNGNRFATAFLVVLYENATLPTVSSLIVLNAQDLINNEYYNINGISPINNSYPVAYSLYSDRINDTSTVPLMLHMLFLIVFI